MLRPGHRMRLNYLHKLGLATCLALAFQVSASHSFTLTDNYYGGLNTYNNNPPTSGDVIGDASIFGINSITATRPNANTLDITINTAYAGVPNTPAADGTNYGSLFFNTTTNVLSNGSVWNPTGSAPYPTDVYTPGNWNYALTMNGSIGPNGAVTGATSGTSNLYAISGTKSLSGPQTPNYYSGNPSVVQSYSVTNGTIVMSNVYGDPVTYPYAGNLYYYFRQGQAVQFLPGANAVSSASGTWSVSETDGLITYVITDDGLLGNVFAISWAMTCANDIIQGVVDLTQGTTNTNTPIPAALPLFAGGLGLLGLLRRRRKTLAN